MPACPQAHTVHVLNTHQHPHIHVYTLYILHIQYTHAPSEVQLYTHTHTPSEVDPLLRVLAISVLVVMAGLVEYHLHTIPSSLALLRTVPCYHVQLTNAVLQNMYTNTSCKHCTVLCYMYIHVSCTAEPMRYCTIHVQ